MRYGLISNYRRSWSPIGVRTIVDNQQAFSNRYLFSAVSPITGDSFHLMGFEENSSAMVSIFFDEMEKKFEGKHIVVIFDNAPSHRPKIIHARKNITCIFLPPYSPELNPDENVWAHLKGNKLKTHQAQTVGQLKALTFSGMKSIQMRPQLVQSFFGEIL